ncbi:ABC transporter ATP-binding protein, partial [Gilvimarinus sp. 1_MG-2023]|nr:ABC transporter ATP-binding protein [Gilvimarinus sp. 1_MG-2023]
CTSVRALLANMKSETFVFDLMSQAPADLQLAGWVVRVVGEDTIEVVVKEGQSINSVFEALSAKGCLVRSMRPKSNRLEELFVDLVQGDNQ